MMWLIWSSAWQYGVNGVSHATANWVAGTSWADGISCGVSGMAGTGYGGRSQ